MATVNVINGTAVNIGFAGTAGGLTITSPAISTKLILQSADESNDAENYRVFDEVGNRVTSAWTDPHKKATLEFIIKGTDLTDVIAATELVEAIAPGDLLTVGACDALPGLIATNWEVMSGPKISGTNKDAKKFTCNVESAPGITAVADPGGS